MRLLFVVLGVQLVLGAAFLVLVATDSLPFTGGDSSGAAPASRANRFDGAAAFKLVELQLSYGPRPAGSQQSRKLAEKLRSLLPNGRFQAVPGGLRNIVGTVPGKDPRRFVVVGAHYDSKDIPGFLGANDGAGGSAAVVQLARQLEPRTIGPTVRFVLLDGEESPAGAPENQFLDYGLRGSKVAARKFKDAGAMILLDFVADKRLSLPRERTSNPALWAQLRSAAEKAGVIAYFPDSVGIGIQDDHTPFLEQGVPSIDLIDWDFPCFHRTCDNLSAVSEKSLDASGEAVAALLPTL
ncbi:MAG: glutaminyl-peptide cyclotransferase [Thermoleophilaceae bacterium]|nr:glutaminyl-peptide cyclotransferase [Thermoleophilaceae bacterium]